MRISPMLVFWMFPCRGLSLDSTGLVCPVAVSDESAEPAVSYLGLPVQVFGQVFEVGFPAASAYPFCFFRPPTLHFGRKVTDYVFLRVHGI